MLEAVGRGLRAGRSRSCSNQFDAGTVSQLDVAQAQTQLRPDPRPAGRRGRQPRPVRARDRRPDRQRAGRGQHRGRAAARGRADDRCRHPVGAARAAARHRLGRAADGGGQCPDRRRGGGLLSGHHARRQHQLRQHACSAPAVHDRQRRVVGRARSSPARRSTAARAAPRSRARGPTTTGPSRPIARPCSPPSSRSRTGSSSSASSQQQEKVQRAAAGRRARGRAPGVQPVSRRHRALHDGDHRPRPRRSATSRRCSTSARAA